MTSPQKKLSPLLIVWMMIVISLLSFLPLLVSGRWTWWEGWILAIIFMGNFIFSRILLIRHDPDLVMERSRSLKHGDMKSWDKILAPLMAFGGVLISVVAGLDARFDWSSAFTLQVQVLALLVILAGIAVGNWALIVNRFFSGVVRIQSERGHQVISVGPYQWIRHPGYAATLWAYLAIPFFLNSVWAILPALIIIIVGIIRTFLEDRVLQEELKGYRDYAQQVRYRLVPGIW